VTDLSVSFYGGSYIKKTDGTLAVWSQKDTYGASSTTESWYPPSDTAGCQCTTAYKDQTLTAPSGVFSKIACGGKRNGSLPPPTHSSAPLPPGPALITRAITPLSYRCRRVPDDLSISTRRPFLLRCIRGGPIRGHGEVLRGRRGVLHAHCHGALDPGPPRLPSVLHLRRL
jgi:hypothetical protein